MLRHKKNNSFSYHLRNLFFLIETVSRIHFKLAHLFILYRPIFDIRIHNRWATGQTMSEKRILRKMKKLASRIGDKIESVRDEVEDLEIEFEILQKQIKKLETKSFYDKETKGEKRQSDDEEDIDEDDEVVDLENTSVVTVKPKF